MSNLEVLVRALEKHADSLRRHEWNSVGGDYVIVGEFSVTDVIMELATEVRKLEAQQNAA